MDNLLNYFLELEKLKNTNRYGKYTTSTEHVSDHSFFVCLLSIKLMEEYKLNLDFKKVVKMSLIHDVCELGLEYDYGAYEAYSDIHIAETKKQYEENKIAFLSQTFGDNELAELFEEYETQASDEAKFVKTVDKFETTINIIRDDKIQIAHGDFTARYSDKYVQNFPTLKPFLREIKLKLKERYSKSGLIWKSEYDIF